MADEQETASGREGTARRRSGSPWSPFRHGVSWIAVLATLNVSAQVALPDWVRGRGLAIFGAVLFGSMTAGSAVWGQVATIVGLPVAHFIAAAGALAAIPLTWRWKVQTGPGIDLTPSMHWPSPVITYEVEPDRGPVLVAVEYRIQPANREAFVAALERLGHERRRDGAYAWGLFEDTAEQGRFLETFFIESWIENIALTKAMSWGCPTPFRLASTSPGHVLLQMKFDMFVSII